MGSWLPFAQTNRKHKYVFLISCRPRWPARNPQDPNCSGGNARMGNMRNTMGDVALTNISRETNYISMIFVVSKLKILRLS